VLSQEIVTGKFSTTLIMSRSFSVTEPHPSVAKGGYIGSGRGGAGNYKSYKHTEVTAGPTASGPAARISLIRPSKRAVVSGRGGAGNVFTPTEPEEAMFQFDEEMVKKREFVAPMYHIGRGGAANWVDETKPRSSRANSSDSSASMDSERSTASSVRRSMEGAFGRLARRVSKQ